MHMQHGRTLFTPQADGPAVAAPVDPDEVVKLRRQVARLERVRKLQRNRIVDLEEELSKRSLAIEFQRRHIRKLGGELESAIAQLRTARKGVA